MENIVLILCTFASLIIFLCLLRVNKKSNKIKTSQSKIQTNKYYTLMRDLGIEEWIIKEEYSKIKSLKELISINDKLQKVIELYKL